MILTCMIIGDCIATRPHGLGGRFSQCEVSATVGASSKAILNSLKPKTSKWVVISAGSNDPTNSRLASNLEAIRAKVKTSQVIWVQPVHPVAAKVVRSVALRYGDMVIPFTPGRDNVHPKSYKSLATTISKVIK